VSVAASAAALWAAQGPRKGDLVVGTKSSDVGGAAAAARSSGDGRGRKPAGAARPGEWLAAPAGRGRSPDSRADDHRLRGHRPALGPGPPRKTTAESWGSEDPSLTPSEEEEEEAEAEPPKADEGTTSAAAGSGVGGGGTGRERGKKELKSKKDRGAQQQRERRMSKDDHQFKTISNADYRAHDHRAQHAALPSHAAAAGPHPASLAAPGVGLVMPPLPPLPNLALPRAAMGQTAGAARRAAGAAAREGAFASRLAAGAARRRLGGLSGQLLRVAFQLLRRAWRVHRSCGALLLRSWPLCACVLLPLAVRGADCVGAADWAPHWVAPCLAYSYLAQLLEQPRHLPGNRPHTQARKAMPRPPPLPTPPRPHAAAVSPTAAAAAAPGAVAANSDPAADAPAARASVGSASSLAASGGSSSLTRPSSSSSSSSGSVAAIAATQRTQAADEPPAGRAVVRRVAPKVVLSLVLLSEGFADRSVLLDFRTGHLLLLAFLLAVSAPQNPLGALTAAPS
jgi:hypothetical protein